MKKQKGKLTKEVETEIFNIITELKEGIGASMTEICEVLSEFGYCDEEITYAINRYEGIEM